MCAGSNPAGGTLHEVPKDPAISAFAEDGVFAYEWACVARSGTCRGLRPALLAHAGHGHEYATNAMLSATVLASPGPVTS